MTTLTMDMSSYETECNDQADCHEIAGWSPALQSCQEEKSRRIMPADLIVTDAEAFLEIMYAYQS